MLVVQTGSTMTDVIEVDGHTLDDTSQIILQVLRDRGGTASTSLLAERADDSDEGKEGNVTTDHVRYRVHQHLCPLRFVEVAGQLERGGGTWDEYTYRLTDRGIEFLDEHQEEVRNAVDAATATERLRETRRTVDRFDGRLHSTEGDVAQLIDTVEALEEQLDQAEDDIDSVHNKLQRKRNQLEERLDDRIDEVESELTALRQGIQNTADYVAQNRDLIQELQEAVRGFSDRTDALLERIESTEDDLADLRRSIENSPFGRFL